MCDTTKKNKNLLQHEKIDWSYLAGFFDGDGSLIAQIVSRPDYVLKYQIRLTVSFIQKTDRKHFLIKIQDELGRGTLRDRGDTVSELNLVGQKNVSWFLIHITPFLRIKKKQANIALKIIEQMPLTKNSPEKFLELCEKADQIAQANDSKKRTFTTEVVKGAFQDLKILPP